jgi:hypothetical protein
MSATLVIHEEHNDVTYHYDDVKDLGARLVDIFNSADHPKGATLIVGSDNNFGELTLRIGDGWWNGK